MNEATLTSRRSWKLHLWKSPNGALCQRDARLFTHDINEVTCQLCRKLHRNLQAFPPRSLSAQYK